MPVHGPARTGSQDDEPGRQATGQPEPPPRQPGHIPAGPRGEPAAEADWVRAIGRRRRL